MDDTAPRRAGHPTELLFVTEDTAGISRVSAGDSFRYKAASGKMVRDKRTVGRIRRLAIPPAWTEVWICASARGHIQATGRDARGRKQYRYHADWNRMQDEAKFDRLVEFGERLPAVRKAVSAHMVERGLGRDKVLATITHLLDITLIRVGNEEYARNNKSFGLTTLRDRHALINSGGIRLAFRGKTGKEWRLRVTDRRVARIVRGCQELPGQHLFQYEDEAGKVRRVTSNDINEYLRAISGADISAKDFRTWAGTVLASVELQAAGPPDNPAAAKRHIRNAIGAVAARLGNTVAVCRKCYVHPKVIACYTERTFEKFAPPLRSVRGARARLSRDELATLGLLKSNRRSTKAKGSPLDQLGPSTWERHDRRLSTTNR